MNFDAGAFDAFQLLHGIWCTFCAWHLTQINFTCQSTQIYVLGNWRRIFFFQHFFWIFFLNFFQKLFFLKKFLFKFFLNFFFFLATVKLSDSLLCKYILSLKSFRKLTLLILISKQAVHKQEKDVQKYCHLSKYFQQRLTELFIIWIAKSEWKMLHTLHIYRTKF